MVSDVVEKSRYSLGDFRINSNGVAVRGDVPLPGGTAPNDQTIPVGCFGTGAGGMPVVRLGLGCISGRFFRGDIISRSDSNRMPVLRFGDKFACQQSSVWFGSCHNADLCRPGRDHGCVSGAGPRICWESKSRGPHRDSFFL